MLKLALTCPAMAFVAVVIICRLGVPRWERNDSPKAKQPSWTFRWDKEFYPFNSFPMYADPGPEPSEYVIVCDGNDAPFSVERITGDSSAKVKKKYVAARNRLADKAGIKKADEAPRELCVQAWQQAVDGCWCAPPPDGAGTPARGADEAGKALSGGREVPRGGRVHRGSQMTAVPGQKQRTPLDARSCGAHRGLAAPRGADGSGAVVCVESTAA